MPVEIITGGGGGGWGSMPANKAYFEYYCAECGAELAMQDKENVPWLHHFENTESSGFLGLGSKPAATQCVYALKSCELPRIIFQCRILDEEPTKDLCTT